MRFRDLHLKLKGLRLRRIVWRINGGKRRRKIKKQPSWMNPVSHGYHVIDRRVIGGYCSDEDECDSVVIQREQRENTELWCFGIFDALIGDGVTKYMQSHLFQKQLKESHITRKCKETLKRAYLNVRAKMRSEDERMSHRIGSAVSAIVINGEKLMTAHIGHCKAVVCRDGVAYHTNPTAQQAPHWTRKLFKGMMTCESSDAGDRRQSRSSELAVRAERIDSDTEFLILATNGIWDVMKNQEAVNLIRHIENPNEAAQCLANEALNRMSKSNISCIIIRLD
ncbi:putative protein phosphatase 2C-like protein 44 [Prosopis cineraria]|uniref:putative protein phosphatase 2C-like protein 44 n=1 Tax=Prosopis cineraria TaxID=364024 RepID=UPI00240F612A|nr:putative protein phosphatase 2C-like protein 44 [Prosopis cineraria]